VIATHAYLHDAFVIAQELVLPQHSDSELLREAYAFTLVPLVRDVRIRIMVPGEHTDSHTVGAASRANWGRLLEAGVEIHVYQPTTLHNKMLVADRLLVSCGSTNFDPRSFHLNDEASLNLYDAGFADAMTAVFEQDLKQARRYTLQEWQDRPMRERLHELVVRPIRSQL
jgi:cardiolipin synthase